MEIKRKKKKQKKLGEELIGQSKILKKEKEMDLQQWGEAKMYM